MDYDLELPSLSVWPTSEGYTPLQVSNSSDGFTIFTTMNSTLYLVDLPTTANYTVRIKYKECGQLWTSKESHPITTIPVLDVYCGHKASDLYKDKVKVCHNVNHSPTRVWRSSSNIQPFFAVRPSNYIGYLDYGIKIHM